MSLIRKHVAVLQAWACLALVSFVTWISLKYQSKLIVCLIESRVTQRKPILRSLIIHCTCRPTLSILLILYILHCHIPAFWLQRRNKR